MRGSSAGGGVGRGRCGSVGSVMLMILCGFFVF